jgi:hypothetical protein
MKKNIFCEGNIKTLSAMFCLMLFMTTNAGKFNAVNNQMFDAVVLSVPEDYEEDVWAEEPSDDINEPGKNFISGSKYSQKYKDILKNEIFNKDLETFKNELTGDLGKIESIKSEIKDYFNLIRTSSFEKISKIKKSAEEKFNIFDKTDEYYDEAEAYNNLINEIYTFAKEYTNSNNDSSLRSIVFNSIIEAFYHVSGEIYFDAMMEKLSINVVEEIFKDIYVIFDETLRLCEENLKDFL